MLKSSWKQDRQRKYPLHEFWSVSSVRTELKEIYWYEKWPIVVSVTIWACRSKHARSNTNRYTSKIRLIEKNAWNQIFCDTCRYWNRKLGVSFHAPLSGVASTRLSSIIEMIACEEGVRAKVSNCSSSVTVPAVILCKVCRRWWCLCLSKGLLWAMLSIKWRTILPDIDKLKSSWTT